MVTFEEIYSVQDIEDKNTPTTPVTSSQRQPLYLAKLSVDSNCRPYKQKGWSVLHILIIGKTEQRTEVEG